MQYEKKENKIIVTEVPYATYTNTICKELEELEADENNGIDSHNDGTGKNVDIEIYLKKNTDPDKVMFELDVYWAVMGQQDPVEWMENYPNRFKLLHIKDRWIIGDSGMMNFPNIFKKAYEIGILGYYVELEGDKKGRTQFEGVEKSAAYLQAAPFVK